MTDPMSIALVGASIIATLLVASVAILKGWHGWLELKRMELDRACDGAPVTHATGGRIEIADSRQSPRGLISDGLVDRGEVV
jgi:hypothetical protein